MANNQTLDLKNKFGLMLCYLFDAGFSLEYISHKIVHDPFFLFFENNDALSFLQLPIESIVEKVFSKRVYIDYLKPVQSELFWAGTMYVSLLLNERVPLQRSALILPLDRMLSLFGAFHEMADNQFFVFYSKEEERLSVLRLLNDRDLTVRQLSFLLGINQSTLNSYLDNRKLFAASFDTLMKLSSFFHVPSAVFQKESSFMPDIDAFFHDPDFTRIYIDLLCKYLNLKQDRVVTVDSSVDKPTMKKTLDNGGIAVVLRDRLVVKKVNNAPSSRSLSDDEQAFIAQKALKTFRDKKHIAILF